MKKNKENFFLIILLIIVLIVYTISIITLIILNSFIDYSKITYQTKHDMVTIDGKIGYNLDEYEWNEAENGYDLILHFEKDKE